MKKINAKRNVLSNAARNEEEVLIYNQCEDRNSALYRHARRCIQPSDAISYVKCEEIIQLAVDHVKDKTYKGYYNPLKGDSMAWAKTVLEKYIYSQCRRYVNTIPCEMDTPGMRMTKKGPTIRVVRPGGNILSSSKEENEPIINMIADSSPNPEEELVKKQQREFLYQAMKNDLNDGERLLVTLHLNEVETEEGMKLAGYTTCGAYYTAKKRAIDKVHKCVLKRAFGKTDNVKSKTQKKQSESVQDSDCFVFVYTLRRNGLSV